VHNYRANIGQTYNLMYQQNVQAPFSGQRVADQVSQNMYQATRINKSKWSKK